MTTYRLRTMRPDIKFRLLRGLAKVQTIRTKNSISKTVVTKLHFSAYTF